MDNGGGQAVLVEAGTRLSAPMALTAMARRRSRKRYINDLVVASESFLTLKFVKDYSHHI